MVQHSPSSSDRATELAECGWRTEMVTHPDGSITPIQIPLTAEEFLHPKEGYRLPNSTFHDAIAGEAKDLLTRRYADTPDAGVFRDLLIEWDISQLADHCPDTFVVFGIQNREQIRNKFIVVEEGTRPVLILEVVSPRYRKADRETKVIQYAQAGVQEYVILDRRTYRRQTLDEVLGYRLMGSSYVPITPDDDRRILCQTVGLWISLQDGHLVMEDAQTGERLKTSLELAAENQELAAENQELTTLLARYREQFGDLSGV
jgi:Uma2 family endonuclease